MSREDTDHQGPSENDDRGTVKGAPLDSEGRTLKKPAIEGDSAEATLVKGRTATQADEADVPAHWKVGDVILDTYEVKAELGKGAFGVVHRVHHKGWNTDLAVKSATGFLDEDEIRKIHREAEVWMELGLHPNIVSCFFVRNLGGSPRIFVEYAEGGTLHEWLYGRPPDSSEESAPMGQREDDSKSGKKPRELTRAQRLAIAIEMCRGMHHAHTFKWKDKDGDEHEGLVHRDLKPLNILMTEDGIPRVTDFGLVGYGLPTETTTASKDSGTTPEGANETEAEAALVKPEGDRNVPNDSEEVDLSSIVDTNAIPTMVKKPKDDGSENATIRKPTEEDESDSDSYPDFLDPRIGATQRSIHGGNTAGTPQYMAPEQWDPHTPTTKAADIYAFGVILYELFCGRRAFELPEEYRHIDPKYQPAFWEPIHREETPPDPRALKPDVDPELARIMLRCLEKMPENRPANFAAVRDQLKAIHQRLEDEDYDTLYPEPKATELLGDSLNNKALSYLEMGRNPKARVLWQQALKIDSLHIEATYNAGLVDWRDARITDRVLVLRMDEVRTNHGNDWRAQFLLGLIHLERGDGDAATAILESASIASGNNLDVTAKLREAHALGPSCIRIFEGHNTGIDSVFLSRRGDLALSGANDKHSVLSGKSVKTLRLWELSTGRCVRAFGEDTGDVYSVCLSENGRWALSGGRPKIGHDQSLRLWDTSTGRCVRVFEKHGSVIRSVCLSKDAHWALTAGDDKTIRLWDVLTGRCARVFEGHTSYVWSACLCNDEKWVLTGSDDKTLRLWEVSTGRCIRTFEGHTGRVTSVCVSEDLLLALSASRDKTLRLWEVSTGRCVRIFEGHTADVNSACLSKDARWAVSSSDDETLRVWDVSTGRCVRTFKGHSDGFSSAVLSADAKWILSGGGSHSSDASNTVRLWKMPNIAKAPLAFCRVTAVRDARDDEEEFGKFMRDAQNALAEGRIDDAYRCVVSGRALSGRQRDSNALDVWNRLRRYTRTSGFLGGWHVRTFEGHTGPINSVCLSSDGRRALSASADKTVRLWELSTGCCIRTFEGNTHTALSVCLSADGRWALSGSRHNLQLWDVLTGRCARTLKGNAPVCMSMDSRWALSGSEDMKPRLWELSTGRCVVTFEAHIYELRAVCFSRDGRWALTGSDGSNPDDSLRLWEVSTGRCVKIFGGHTGAVASVCLSADGLWALSGSQDNTIRLWDVSTGGCVRAFEDHPDPTIAPVRDRGGFRTFSSGVNSVCLSEDGNWALSGNSDYALVLWEVSTGRCVRKFESRMSETNSVCLSKDGRWALSVEGGDSFRLWELEWDIDPFTPADWDEGARPHLKDFLSINTPYAAPLPRDHQPTEEEVQLALTREGLPTWTDNDFEGLLRTLGYAGYGWLSPAGVRQNLEEMKAALRRASTKETNHNGEKGSGVHQVAIWTDGVSRLLAERLQVTGLHVWSLHWNQGMNLPMHHDGPMVAIVAQYKLNLKNEEFWHNLMSEFPDLRIIVFAETMIAGNEPEEIDFRVVARSLGRKIVPPSLYHWDADPLEDVVRSVQELLQAPTVPLEPDVSRSAPTPSSPDGDTTGLPGRNRNTTKLKRETSKRSLASSCEVPGYDIIETFSTSVVADLYEAIKKDSKQPMWLRVYNLTHVEGDDISLFSNAVERLCSLPATHFLGVVDGGFRRRFWLAEKRPNGTQWLQQYLESLSEPVPLEHGVRFALRLLDGLSLLHDTGIVHGTLAPCHVSITKGTISREVRISGLHQCHGLPGIERLLERLQEAGAEDILPPTPPIDECNCMAPESARGHTAPPADVFAVGAILYRMLTGCLIRELSTHPHIVLEDIVMKKPVPIGDRDANIPRAIAEVIDKALSMDPKERYQDGAEMRNALSDAARQCSLALSSPDGDTLRQPGRDGDTTEPKGETTKSGASEREAPEICVGDVLRNRYEVQHVLWSGAFSNMYQVKDRKDDNLLALLVPTFNGSEDEERFSKHGVFMKTLMPHPRIIEWMGDITVDGCPGRLFEYAPGGSLWEWLEGDNPGARPETPAIERHDMSIKDKVRIAIHVCEGMQRIEECGFVHRDLKPTNILMFENGEAKVADLELLMRAGQPLTRVDESEMKTLVKPAVVDDSEMKTLVKPIGPVGAATNADDPSTISSIQGTGVAGTPAYMSPEQFDGSRHLDSRSDIYSFGVVLYQMFCGRRPIELPAEYKQAMDALKIVEFERMHKEQAPRDPKEICPDLPDSLTSLILHCLAKDREKRPQAFSDVLKHLHVVSHAVQHLPEKKKGEKVDSEKTADRSNDELLKLIHDNLRKSKPDKPLPSIPGYEIIRSIGPGRPWSSFIARKLDDDRKVLLRVALSPVEKRDWGERKIIAMEKEVLRRIRGRHPNVIEYIEGGEQDDMFWLAVEHVEGSSLEQHRTKQGGKLPLDEALSLALPLLDGLAHLHRNGFVHRDIKPANIMLTTEQKVLRPIITCLDMGKFYDYEGILPEELWEVHGIARGTPPYMAPEQIVDGRSVRPAADLFAMGATFYHILTGQFIRDFLGNQNQMIRQVVEDPPIPIRDRDSSIPPVVGAVIDKALSMDPKDRYQSAEEMREALKNAAEQCGFRVGSNPKVEEMSRQPSVQARQGSLIEIPGYDMGGEIFRNGDSVVLEARRADNGRRVMVQYVRPKRLVTSREEQRFVRACETIRRLGHPNIIEYIESGEHEGVLWLAMEYIADGLNMVNHPQATGGILPLSKTLSLALPLLDGLALLHEKGIVHGAITPTDIMLVTDWDGLRAVITGFEAETFLRRGCDTQSHGIREGIIGNLPYMPSEQVIDVRMTRPTTDVFAMAATLYQVLTGRTIRNFPRNQNEMIRQVLEDPPIPIRDRDSSIPPVVGAVIDKALSMDPKDRYQGAEEMREALKNAAEQCGVVESEENNE